MATNNGNGRRADRLKSWKEIAAFFDADERTVRRWENRGLPVRRVPGGARATVYAEVGELQAWLAGRTKAAPGAPDPAADPRAGEPSRRRWTLSGAAALIVAGVIALAVSRTAPAGDQARVHEPPQEAVDLYVEASYDWQRRTPDRIRRAIELFGRAIARDPEYAEAYAGLANAHIAARKYSAATEAEAYPRAKAAAERAVELDPNLAEAQTALAFINFYWEWDWSQALRRYRRAIELDPRAALARHSYGMALMHSGDIEGALAQVTAAQRLDPQSRTIRADRGLLLLLAGRTEEGVGLLREMCDEEPSFVSPRFYLAYFHDVPAGDYRSALDHSLVLERLREDRQRVALFEEMERALARGGPRAMLQMRLAGLERLHRQGRESAYVVAGSHALLGHREAALRYLRQAIERREPLALMVRIDPTFRSVRSDPEFRRLAASIGRPA
ncbi:MAG TPA: tetratricopeptide repeat protein [Allosphingosinicella sp.]|nr:tetratricopeptide repeat protein [Allosphingosinicella sp.]